MRIRSKIVAVVLPLVIGALAVSGSSAFFTASNAVSQVTAEFLDFKTDQLEQFLEDDVERQDVIGDVHMAVVIDPLRLHVMNR